MPRNGSGTFTLPAGNPVVNGSVASSSAFNATMTDLATALTNSVAKDGQTTPAANLPMGGFRHTNVSNASARNQYAAAGQVQDGAFLVLGGVSGTNTILASATPAITALVTGQTFRFQSVGENTGGVTLAVDGLSAVSVMKYGAVALTTADIPSLGVAEVFYDGTHFQLLNPRPVDVVVPDEVVALTSVTGTTSIVAGGPTLTGYDSSQLYLLTAAGDSAAGATLQVGSLSSLSVKAYNRAIVSGDFLSGQRLMVAYDGAEFQLLNPRPVLLQTKYAQYTTATTITTDIPSDDTKPQISEGTEILSVAITPSSTTSKIRITVAVPASSGGVSGIFVIIGALFDGNTNAIASAIAANTIQQTNNLSIIYEYVPGTTSSITYSFRVGGVSGFVDPNLNQTAATRFDGTMLCSMTVEEFAA
jgi:hypothetical protein